MIGNLISCKNVWDRLRSTLGRAPTYQWVHNFHYFSEEQNDCFSLVFSNVERLLVYTAKDSLSIPNNPLSIAQGFL